MTERRVQLRRSEDIDLLERMAATLIDIQSQLKLLRGEAELSRFRLVRIERHLGIKDES